jgi:hypothetical protein
MSSLNSKIVPFWVDFPTKSKFWNIEHIFYLGFNTWSQTNCCISMFYSLLGTKISQVYRQGRIKFL